MSTTTTVIDGIDVAEDAAGIATHSLSKSFHVKGADILALKDVSIDIPKGSFVSLIGPSGCGKSTLLRMFADLLDPTSGTPTVGGRTPREARLARELGMVFQAPNLMPWRSVLANVTLPLEVEKVGRTERTRIAMEMLELVGLGGFEHHQPGQLSGGMQQRASIARALVTSPRVLLMDEPFGALDEITRDRLNLELLRIRDRIAPTIVFITHSIAEAVFLSTEVVVMAAKPGRVTGVVPIDLPHPRTAEMRDDPLFHRHVHEVRELLQAGSVGG